jgi:eukaryotic-like serine/threonine-protein kinase
MAPSETLGRLRRVRRLGAGGFATVWLYHDDELDSPVAVKMLADNWSHQLDVRERFLEEARILRRADSDHVVRVYDIGVDEDDRPYFVMAYADKGTVADLLDDGALDLAATIDLVDQAARGLTALHAGGVIHRDVKPPNLLLCSDRQREHRLLVADLGLAKAMMQASGLTQVAGSPAYMAPEQADVGVGIDKRADVHALGAVAYQLLTGRPMRQMAISSVPSAELPSPPSDLVPVADAVDAVILRAVEPDRDDRWPDPLTFAAALRGAAGEPTPADWAPPSAPEPTRTVLRSARFWLLVAAVFVVGYAIGLWLL